MNATLIQVIVTGLLQGLVYALIGLGLYLVFSVMHVVNFAHGGLVLIGMYGVLELRPQGLAHYAIALLIVAAAAAAFGYVIERFLIEPGLNRGGHSQLVITLSLGIILQYAFQIRYPESLQTIASPYPWEALRHSGVTISVPQLAAGAISLLLCALVSWLVYRTQVGAIMRACSGSLKGAMHVGINLPRTYRLTFALGAAAAAVAGGLLLPIQPVSPALGFDLTIKAFIVVVIGGAGALWGTVVAGIGLGLVEAVGSVYVRGSLGTTLIFALFFLTILVRPQGLARKVSTA